MFYEDHVLASKLYAALHTNVEIRTLGDISCLFFCLFVFLPNPLSSLYVSVCLSVCLLLSLFCFRFFRPFFRMSYLYRTIIVNATALTQAYPENDVFMEADQR